MADEREVYPELVVAFRTAMSGEGDVPAAADKLDAAAEKAIEDGTAALAGRREPTTGKRPYDLGWVHAQNKLAAQRSGQRLKNPADFEERPNPYDLSGRDRF